MNNVNIIGRLTRDPELRRTHSGTDVTTLRLAVDTYGDQPTCFIDVATWGPTATACAEHLRKGRQVGVVGELRYREWTQDDVKRSAHSVNAQRVDFLGKPQKADEPSASQEPQDGGTKYEDDIPF